ncbi:MAG TPA: hypothetical protein VFL16_01935 [Steroidobacteraceae bacterium]|jgi:hypothetical protein|nr:hypothetical protein [Steroidobacteraceae bacterium]
MNQHLKSLLVAVSFGLAAAVATGEDYHRVYELSSRAVDLPKADVGTLEATPCKTCASLHLSTNARTIYQIGEYPVSLEQMRKELSVRPETMVLLSVAQDQRTVIRLKIDAAVQTS